MCAYVNSIAGQDELNEGAIVDSSAFPRNNPNNPVGLLPAPLNLHAVLNKNTAVGSIHVIWDRVAGFKIYGVTVTGPDAYSFTFTTTKAKAIVPGLTSGGLYQVVAHAIGTDGPGNESNPFTVRAL